MAIQVPDRPNELAELLGTEDPREQVECIQYLLLQEPVQVLTILYDPRSGRTALSATGQDLTTEQALILLVRARKQLLADY